MLATLAKEGEPAVAAAPPPPPPAPVVDAPVRAMLASLEKAEEALGCLGGGGAAVLDCAVKLAAEWGALARGAAGGEGGGIVCAAKESSNSASFCTLHLFDFGRGCRYARSGSLGCFRVIDSFADSSSCDYLLRDTITQRQIDQNESVSTLRSGSGRETRTSSAE